MKLSMLFPSRLLLGLGCLAALTTQVGAQVLTIQIGTPAPPPTPLVNHGDQWRYRKGNSEPQADWKTAVDSGLDDTWLTGPGGFGYGDGDDATMLSDMLGGYNTVYTRKTFEVVAPVDPSRHVILTMDWDDGFVAYLDGAEVARSPNVTVANPLFNSATTPGQNHEASAGVGGLPPTSYDLGSVGSLLAPGTHILAVHGLNSDTGSTDFSLIADLRLTGGSQAAGGGDLFAIVSTITVPLSGTNTIPGATRVTVNGEPASFNPATGEWTRLHTLAPGLNHLFVAALDATGALMASTNRDVIYETASTTVSGVLSDSPVWDGANGTIHITSPVVVPDGVTLRITNGAVVLLASGASLRATTNGVILATGARNQPVLFAPLDGVTPWGDVGAFGTNASLTLSYAEVVAGQIRPVNGGMVLIEDSILRDFTDPRSEFISANSGGGLIMRRTYGARFGEMDASETPVLIEDSLLERFAADGLDIKGTNVPLVVRRTTLRLADPSNSNADGLDFGPGAGTVERCLIYGFPDKGVSIGGAPGTMVHDSLIFDCGIGISAYSSINLSFANSTISRCAAGILFRNNPTLAVGVASNLIVWGNTANVIMSNTSVLTISYSDIEATNWPGPGNLSADPLFVDSARNDFRLAAGSPAIGAGFGGVNMGTSFPVGGLPPAPFNLAAIATGTNAIRVVWQEDADNETGFEIERSTNGVDWAWLTGFGANVTNHVDDTAELDQRYFYRVRAFNSAGESLLSNPASAIRQQPMTVVGGTLAANTAWSPAMGTIVVVSNITVPANVTLTVLPGTLVKLTNGASIRAISGGAININGTAESKVTFTGVDGTNTSAEISAQFAGSSLTIRHADISRRQTTVMSNAVALCEDSFFHDYRLVAGGPALTTFNQPLMLSRFAQSTTVRRCHFREYYETLFRDGLMLIEECLFENIYGDGVDFDGARPGSVLRRCTFRHGDRGNVDAVDVGPGESGGCTNMVIEDCVMFDFPFDKGVSIGDNGASRGTVVRNCLIYDCQSGIMAKDSCDVTVYHCTLADNRWGFTNYNKNGSVAYTGGHTTNFNSVLWNNIITVSMRDNGTFTSDHSDLGNTNWPGVGNIDVDPLFLNPASRDYRVAGTSPVLGAGRNGADLGARFPVGAPMALSHPRIESFGVASGAAVIRFWADSEKTYSVLCSDAVSGGTWVKLADVSLNSVPRFLSITNALAPDNRFYRLVTPAWP